MPYRSKELLQQWVAEFHTESPGSISGEIDVLIHDAGAGSDTGLVVVRMADLPADVYLHPISPGNPKWEIHFGPRDRELALSGDRLRGLTVELSGAVLLCEFFERKSAERDRAQPVPTTMAS